jgi:hypothetical protein
VIEGGGWVGVGDERTRVLAGETVVWPPNVVHAAWTDGTRMRAIVVELPVPPLPLGTGSLEGVALPPSRPVTKGEGSLAPRPGRPVSSIADPDHNGEPV